MSFREMVENKGRGNKMRTYPITLRLSDDGPVVRFTSRNEGTVIVGAWQYKKGFHSTNWISSQDTIMWTEV